MCFNDARNATWYNISVILISFLHVFSLFINDFSGNTQKLKKQLNLFPQTFTYHKYFVIKIVSVRTCKFTKYFYLHK